MKRSNSRTSAYKQAQRRLDKTTAHWSHQQTELARLYQRLLRFEQENAANAEPVEAERLVSFRFSPSDEAFAGVVRAVQAQTIEAGIKESKQVFYLHHLKVRSEPAISLQEAFVMFAANFIRWASH